MTDSTDRSLRDRLRLLYEGRSQRARRFRLGLLAFDLLVVVFFVVTTFLGYKSWILVVDYLLAVALVLDLAARWWISKQFGEFLSRPVVVLDVAVIVSLLAPAFIENLAFLRVLRTLRLVRGYHVLRDLTQHSNFFARHEEVAISALNLILFVFVISSLVYVLQNDTNPAINDYVGALYFTVTTLTTTGFGDITLTGQTGRILAVIIMIAGLGLFLRLLQAFFRPVKVSYQCPDCGLRRHDPDAVHCKHCGHLLNIPTPGD